MRFEVVTLFPELFASPLAAGLLGKAIDAGRLDVHCVNPRDHTADKHRSVDDGPYGGGSGMVMTPGPIVASLEALDEARGEVPTRRVLMTPQGERFSQQTARRWSELPCITLVCARYEGIDERARRLVDEEVSLGDFVLLGGEVGALAVIEAVGRLVPGVLGNADSLSEESHTDGLLEYPQYTRPAVFRDQGVPAVLTSGNHAVIARWRRREALRRTRERRPDMFASAQLSEDDRELLAELDAELATDEASP